MQPPAAPGAGKLQRVRDGARLLQPLLSLRPAGLRHRRSGDPVPGREGMNVAKSEL